jgi:hypothetical protein
VCLLLQIPVGGDLSINYVASATRTIAGAAGLVSVNAECTSGDPAGLLLERVTVQVNGAVPLGGDRSVGTTVVGDTPQSVPFTNLPVADALGNAQVRVICQFQGVAPVTSSSESVQFSDSTVGAIGSTATLTAITTLPNWSQYFQPPRLTQAPTVSYPQNSPPNGMTLTNDQVVTWTLQLQDAYVCLAGAQVRTQVAPVGLAGHQPS